MAHSSSAPTQISINARAATRLRAGHVWVYQSDVVSRNNAGPGALVHVKFSPQSPNRGLAREVAIIAAPGASFTYIGKITHLDVHHGILAVQNVVDDKNYEIYFKPSAHADVKDQLAVGTEVRVVAVFEGTRYTAQSINVTKASEEKQ